MFVCQSCTVLQMSLLLLLLALVCTLLMMLLLSYNFDALLMQPHLLLMSVYLTSAVVIRSSGSGIELLTVRTASSTKYDSKTRLA
jgi:hypothetical protein